MPLATHLEKKLLYTLEQTTLRGLNCPVRRHQCSITVCGMEIGVKASGSARDLQLFLRTRANHSKSSVKAQIPADTTSNQAHVPQQIHSPQHFWPVLFSKSQPLTCCCLYHTGPEWHITSTSSSAEGGRSSTEEHGSGNDHIPHWQDCLQCPPLERSVLQKPHLPQSTKKGESMAASAFSNDTWTSSQGPALLLWMRLHSRGKLDKKLGRSQGRG